MALTSPTTTGIKLPFNHEMHEHHEIEFFVCFVYFVVK
jgi:hypothetical protein